MTGSPPPHAPDGAFFLDIDGTLLEHAATPDAVHVDAPVRTLLGALHAGTGGALALISGRALADVDALFAPLKLAVAGQHGVERRDAAGRMHLHADELQPLRRAAARIAAFAAAHEGLVFEDKGHNLALHYRRAPRLAGEARALIESLAAELGEGYELQAGKMVLELKPWGRDKGTAIEEYMAEAPFRGRTPVFVGDDLTDEFGFGVVNRLGGVSVKVGAGATIARWRLVDAPAVRAWLGQWTVKWGAPRAGD